MPGHSRIESIFDIIQGASSSTTGLQNQPDTCSFITRMGAGCMLCSKMEQQKGRQSTHLDRETLTMELFSLYYAS